MNDYDVWNIFLKNLRTYVKFNYVTANWLIDYPINILLILLLYNIILKIFNKIES